MKLFLTFICLFLVMSGLLAQDDKSVVSLKGFDPVMLVQGKEIKGKNDISTIRGRFKYLFAQSNVDVNKEKTSAGCMSFPGDDDCIGIFKSLGLKFEAEGNQSLGNQTFMHDGSIATLEEVIEHYKSAGRTISEGKYAGKGNENPYKSSFVNGFRLTEAEKQDLIAFLKSLTDTEFITNPKFSNPWQKK